MAGAALLLPRTVGDAVSATSRQSVRRAATARARGLCALTNEEWPDDAFADATIAPRWRALYAREARRVWRGLRRRGA